MKKYFVSWRYLSISTVACIIYFSSRPLYVPIPELFTFFNWSIGYADLMFVLLIFGVGESAFINNITIFRRILHIGGDSSFDSDCAINNPQDDLLDYSQQTKDFADYLRKTSCDHSCSIGVVGAWGGG